MRVDNSYLLPQMGATGTGATGAQMLNDEATFQEQLKAATDKLDSSSTKIKTMTDDEVAQRNKEIKDASVQLEAIFLKLMYNEELTKKAAEGGGIGLADFIYKQLTKNQSTNA